jgi:hypothetical protein
LSNHGTKKELEYRSAFRHAAYRAELRRYRPTEVRRY